MIGTFVAQIPQYTSQWTLLLMGDLLFSLAVGIIVAKAAWDNHNQM